MAQTAWDSISNLARRLRRALFISFGIGDIMAHTFTVKFNGELSALLDKVKDTVSGGGGSLSGDASRGKILGNTPVGKVAVDYVVLDDSQIQFTVVDKPFVAPNSMIESTIREYLA
jgi:hypothetical protein